MRRLSAKRALLLLAFACLLCTALYYFSLPQGRAVSARGPREVIHARQLHEDRISSENREQLYDGASRPLPSSPPPAVHLSPTSESLDCTGAGCRHLDSQEDSISSSQGRSLGRCVMNSQTSKRIKKFVFFIGYPRSGHSIVASFLDAHPHMIVAHEFSLFSWWPKYRQEHSEADLLSSITRLTLLNSLTNSSYWESREGERSCKYVNKGYTLCTNSTWHGKCNRYLEVIGDKRAGGTCEAYLQSPGEFVRNYRELMRLVDLPVRVIHVVRNPYDLITTSALYEAARLKNRGKVSGDNANFVTKIKENTKLSNFQYKYQNDRVLQERVGAIMQLAGAVTNLTELVGRENVLELHNCDMVKDAASFVQRLCGFLDVDCGTDYIEMCAEKVFKNISRSRDYMHWPQEVIDMVEQQKQRYPFFHRYSFNGNC